MPIRSFRRVLIIGLVSSAACEMPSVPSPLPAGTWGGDHISVTVAQASTHVELDCAHADIPVAIQLDQANQFAVAGAFVREHGGPIRLGEVPDSHPASFSGSVTRDTMALAIRLTDSNDSVGSFVLTRGATGRVVKCL
jgi:hypothetical protein